MKNLKNRIITIGTGGLILTGVATSLKGVYDQHRGRSDIDRARDIVEKAEYGSKEYKENMNRWDIAIKDNTRGGIEYALGMGILTLTTMGNVFRRNKW